MNKTNVVNQVSNNTGIATDVCEKVIKAFEEESGEALVNKWKGNKKDKTDIIAGISTKTDITIEECEKIITAFEEVLSVGLSNKLRFFITI